jgi:hypothetical protein
MTYQGANRLLDNPGKFGVPLMVRVTVTDRGEGWASGTVAVTSGGDAMPESPFVQGPGSLEPYWIDPAVLREMKAGEVDRDPFLGTVVRYDPGPNGTGVFTQASSKGSQTNVYAYSLQDGALVYTRQARRDINMLTELQLMGRE